MPTASLYDIDYYAWTLEQAAILRELTPKHPDMPLDHLRLADEIEGLGKSCLRAVLELHQQIVTHLLKIQFAAIRTPVRHWQREIMNFRLQLAEDLTPSLERKLLETLPTRYGLARNRAIDGLECDQPDIADILPRDLPYTVDQVLGRGAHAGWLPAEPADFTAFG
nr:DUF29 domain-containing protein [Skermanella aerolata]